MSIILILILTSNANAQQKKLDQQKSDVVELKEFCQNLEEQIIERQSLTFALQEQSTKYGDGVDQKSVKEAKERLAYMRKTDNEDCKILTASDIDNTKWKICSTGCLEKLLDSCPAAIANATAKVVINKQSIEASTKVSENAKAVSKGNEVQKNSPMPASATVPASKAE